MAWKFISKITPSGTNSVNFTSIPQTYKDLAVIFNVRAGTNNTKDILYAYAGTMSGTTRNLSISFIDNGTSAQPAATSQQNYFMVGYVAAQQMSSGRFGVGMMYIANYTSTLAGNMLSYSTVSRTSTDRALTQTSSFTSGGLGTAISSMRFETQPTSTYAGDTVFYLYGIN